MARNDYYVLPPTWERVVAFDPLDPSDRPTHDTIYLGGALAEVERNGRVENLTFYITSDLETLPAYGPNVVAIVIGDEWARVPRYADRILATFKSYGTSLAVGAPRRLSLLAVASVLQYLRLNLRRLPTFARLCARALRGSQRDRPIESIPLGYLRQTELPMVPIGERRYDAYFKGSTRQRAASRLSPRAWLRSAKTLSRARMMQSLLRVRDRHPGLAIELATLDTFFTGSDREAREYSETMMQTKVALVPRGASLETFRYFEALRAGCVVIAEPVPDRWYYRESPARTIDDWSQLEAAIVPLLRDPLELERGHREALRWWDDVASERALGERIAETLAELGERAASGVPSGS